ncbi:hypothetical protein [Dactylosporangium sp. CA-233914]|uniref:hypothetical protein n=1 Tax=Dactylosporangium sp. CA-233914 TaxID=3239934 RepID=UPI003D91F10F
MIVGPVSAKPNYLLDQGCGASAVSRFSVKVTDATDPPTQLKVTLTYHSDNNTSGELAMSNSTTPGLFEASVPGLPVAA